MSILTALRQETCEVHVAASGGQGARALTCLLADVGQLCGLSAVSLLCGTDPHRVRGVDQTETSTVRFSAAGREPFLVTAVLEPELRHAAGNGKLLIDSAETFEGDHIQSIDAGGIAKALGVPAYLPMVGAVAKTAGWSDLGRVKSAVRMALQATAPYWVEKGLAAVEAGYKAVV